MSKPNLRIVQKPKTAPEVASREVGMALSLPDPQSDPTREFIKSTIKKNLGKWLDLRALFRQRRAILNQPDLMTRWPERQEAAFKTPVEFGIACFGFHATILYAITWPILRFCTPLDIANAERIKWNLLTTSKIEALLVPFVVLLNAKFFKRSLKKWYPFNPYIDHAEVAHLTYIQAITFWYTLWCSILISIVQYTDAYVVPMDDVLRPISLIFAVLIFLKFRRSRQDLGWIFAVPAGKHVVRSLIISSFLTGWTTLVISSLLFFAWPWLEWLEFVVKGK